MSGFDLPNNYVDNPKALLRKNRSFTASSFATPPTNKPVTPVSSTTTAMAQKSLRVFSVPIIANMPVRPIVNMGDKNFELRTGLIMMV